MTDPVTQLCQLIVEKLRDEPEASLADLVTHVEEAIAANSELATALQSHQQMQQDNRDGAKGFQTLFEEGGTVFIEGTHYHLSNPEKFQAALEAVLKKVQSPEARTVNFAPYLQSLVTTYQQWWKLYALTDAIGQIREPEQEQEQTIPSPFDFGLMVQTVSDEREQASSAADPRQEKREKTERLPVLDGIRKYAHEHVLLVGRPGSGKSTALLRLLLEEAAQAQQRSHNSAPIPVLVELRFWDTSVLSRMLAFFKRHDPALEMDESKLSTLLRQGHILVLVDGLNELPSETAKQDVIRFRTDYPQAPMIFTTRDLSIGGDFGLTKKLEMQPLQDAQMRQFVMAYLPEQGEQLLHQLQGRMRSFAETPLLLWMLCSLFQQRGKIPPNLGMVFRQFTQGYERHLKQDVPVSTASRRWWTELLQYLAFVMMEGKPEANPPHPLSPPPALISIPRSEARGIFEQFLQGKVSAPGDRAAECLDDLLEHHLIQENGEQLEFRHQLIQEYYAAEYLLRLLGRKKISNGELQQKYLNYLKWTEPLSVLIALLEHSNNETETTNITHLAQAVDLVLMAKLAGNAPPKLQEQTIQVINQLHVTEWFKTELLSKIYPDKAIDALAQSLESDLFEIRRQAANILERLASKAAIQVLVQASSHPASYVQRTANESLERIKQTRPEEFQSFHNLRENPSEFSHGEKTTIPGLLKALEDSNYGVRRRAAEALGQLGSEAAIPGLLKALEDSNYGVRRRAAEALGQLGSEAAIPGLLKALEDSASDVRRRAAETLGQLGSEAAIPSLLNALEDSNYGVRRRAAEALGQLGSEVAIPGLLKALEDSDYDVRRQAAEALGQLGSEAAIPSLLNALEDSDSDVRRRAAAALGQLGSEAAIPGLLKALEHSDYNVRRRAAETLGQLGNEAAIPGLLKALEDSGYDVRRQAAEALGQLGSKAAIPGLLNALEDSDYDVRRQAAEALGQLGSEAAIPGLLKALEDSASDVRRRAAAALGQLGSEAAIPGLLKALEHSDYNVRRRAAAALGQLGNEAAIPGLLKALEDSNSKVRRRAAADLGQLGNEAAIPGLLKALEDSDYDVRRRAAEALGQLGSEAAIPGLLKALEHSDYDFRRQAVEALGQLDSEAAIPGLLTALEDSDPVVRWKATEALKKSETPSTLSSLYQRQLITTENLSPIIEAIQDRYQFYSYEIASGFVPSGKAISLYFSYAPADEPLQTQLADHLTLLKHQSIITNWKDRQILPGDDHAQVINHQLNTADIILLLISAHSLADDTCYDLEIQRAIERHQSDEARVIPILLRPVDWAGAPFSQLPVLPQNHQPVTLWDNQDEAFRAIAEGIRAVAMELRKEKGDSSE